MDLTSAASIKRLFYLLLVTMLAFAIPSYVLHVQSNWLVWSALLLALITNTNSVLKRAALIGLMGLFIAIGVFISSIFTSLLIPLSIYLLMLTVALIYIGQIRYHYFFLALTINLFAILPLSYPVSMHEALNRFGLVLLGTVIAACAQIVFLPSIKKDESKALLQIGLRELQKLTQEIFTCFIQPEYADNIYLYEHRLHNTKTKFLLILAQLRELTNAKKGVISNSENIFDILMDCAQLRNRVRDHATFSLCKNEMTIIMYTLTTVYSDLIAGKKEIDVTRLDAAIMSLEENYQNVLKIAAREPLVFLLFIESLKKLKENLAKPQQFTLELRNL